VSVRWIEASLGGGDPGGAPAGLDSAGVGAGTSTTGAGDYLALPRGPRLPPAVLGCSIDEALVPGMAGGSRRMSVFGGWRVALFFSGNRGGAPRASAHVQGGVPFVGAAGHGPRYVPRRIEHGGDEYVLVRALLNWLFFFLVCLHVWRQIL
jgi:hypothetical protein